MAYPFKDETSWDEIERDLNKRVYDACLKLRAAMERQGGTLRINGYRHEVNIVIYAPDDTIFTEGGVHYIDRFLENPSINEVINDINDIIDFVNRGYERCYGDRACDCKPPDALEILLDLMT